MVWLVELKRYNNANDKTRTRVKVQMELVFELTFSKYFYSLKSIIYHRSTGKKKDNTQKGHYVVICHRQVNKRGNETNHEWFEFDDENVTRINDIDFYVTLAENERDCYYMAYELKKEEIDETREEANGA